ncbi:MAG: hypothetical protein HPY55_05870 [Firmicutes bacterium]|nr:hypothetical protein [Bacillota bacterium]
MARLVITAVLTIALLSVASTAHAAGYSYGYYGYYPYYYGYGYKPIPAQPAPKPSPAPSTGVGSMQMSGWEWEIVNLVNTERAKAGLRPLQASAELSRVARFKAADMRDKNYFSHQSPTYGSPFQMIKNFGISYRTAGENIAAGQKTPQEVMNAWMNSAGHKANILNPNFTTIGVGHVTGGTYGHYWTQYFIG